MYALAPQVDLVLELRDARAPLSTRNGLFDRILGSKRKLILYTKNDLSPIDPAIFDKWHPSTPYKRIDCRSEKDARAVLNVAKEIHSQMFPPPPLGLRMLITGMPNVGKSTFLNTLRRVGLNEKHKVAKTGGMPGVTRSVSNIIRVSKEPDIYIYDSPGVFVPRTISMETMLTLSIIGAVKQSYVDPVIQADYLLYHLNKSYPTGSAYSNYISEPTNDVAVLLKGVAKRIKRVKKGGEIDDVGAALHWIDRWRQGKEFKLLLDEQDEEAYKRWSMQEAQTLKHFKMDFEKESKRFRKGALL
ncbi:mitochondrial GTPase 1 [Trichomonascus vanleenenianus]|uniref:putative GTPase MTG1 n=1 Tax=Trichomonascus vanleenenianus TaxID=2268995 RepID=UPI003ECB394B